jgi:hypothetical protein
MALWIAQEATRARVSWQQSGQNPRERWSNEPPGYPFTSPLTSEQMLLRRQFLNHNIREVRKLSVVSQEAVTTEFNCHSEM